jgi:hypothetical protein
MALGCELRAPGLAETDPDAPLLEVMPEAVPASSLWILRAPEPELLDDPDERPELAELPDFPELADFPALDAVAALPEEPLRLAELPLDLKSFGRLSELRPTPLSGTRPPELPSFRSMTRLPLSCWIEILLPPGRTFGAWAE